MQGVLEKITLRYGAKTGEKKILTVCPKPIDKGCPDII